MTQTDSERQFRHAETLYRQGDPEGALAQLDALQVTHPTAIPVHFYRSRCLLALDRDDEAAVALETVLSLNPDHKAALLARAELGGEDDFDPLPLLQRAHRIDPDDVRVLVQLASAELLAAADQPDQAEREKTALSCLDRAVSLAPDYADAWRQRGQHYYYRAMAGANEESVSVTDIYGSTYNREMLEQAFAAYSRWDQLENSVHSARQCARVAELLERYEEAAQAMDRALALVPADSPARVFLQEDRDRYAQGKAGAQAQLANLLEQAMASESEDRNVQEDMAYSLLQGTANLVKKGKRFDSALELLAGDESPDELMATNIAFQIYNYAFEADPELVEVSASNYPGYQQKHANACEKALRPLGYRRLADVEPKGLTRTMGTRDLVRLFVHPEEGAAAAFALKPKWPGWIGFLLLWITGKWKAQRLLECSTRFENGVILRSRAAASDPFDNSGIESLKFERLPANAKPADVAKRHRQRVQEYVATGQVVQPLDTVAAIEQNWIETNARKQEYRQQIGFVTDDELRSMLGNQYDRFADKVRTRLQAMAES